MLAYGLHSFQVRFRLSLMDDEEFEDEEDSTVNCNSEQDLCHPLCQCDKCSKWQKVGVDPYGFPEFFYSFLLWIAWVIKCYPFFFSVQPPSAHFHPTYAGISL